jgi:HEAT repeat protein
VRLLGAALLVAGLAALDVSRAAPACAHGGIPVPPPPHTKPPGPEPGERPTHVDPGIGGPPIVTPGSPSTRGPRTTGSRRKKDLTPSHDATWEFWWALNQHRFLDRPRGGASVVTGVAEDGVDAWTLQRDAITRKTVLPALMALVDPDRKQPDDVRASALIALGKLAVDGKPIPRFLGWLENEDASELIRESAALASGLLRRTEPERQLPVSMLDPLRARLLQVFDTRLGAQRIQVPRRTRVFTMYAVGLLGDQPFDERALTRDGRLITKLLWDRVGLPYDKRELRTAPLVALGLAPRVGMPQEVRESLKALVQGETIAKRNWDPYEQSEALTTLARLGGPSARSLMMRTLSTAKAHDALQLAAVLGVIDDAEAWTAVERVSMARTLIRGIEKEERLLLVGLRWLALGRMVEADLQSPKARLVHDAELRGRFETAAQRAPWFTRGYALLALAFAARGAAEGGAEGRAFHDRAIELLQDNLTFRRRHASVRAAAAVGLGLMRATAAVPALASVAASPTSPAELRGHAALALGRIGIRSPAVRSALAACRAADGDVLPGRAARAQALLGQPGVAADLIAALEKGGGARRLGPLTVALGHLGDLSAVESLLGVATSAAPEVVRAMAIVALGRLLDPEPRPSLLRILVPANYPVRGKALQEALTIL